ncbi:MAG: hypothetical protein U0792_11535 [Gemmataceae bacterium]
MSRTTQWVLGSLALLAFLWVLWGPIAKTRHEEPRGSETWYWDKTRYGLFGYRTEEQCNIISGSWYSPDESFPKIQHPEDRTTASRTAFFLTLLVTLGVLIPLAVVMLRRSTPALPDRQQMSFPSEAS